MAHSEAHRAAKCYVVHDLYGCESGCCGHRVYGVTAGGEVIGGKFEFAHPYGDDQWEFAEELARDEFPGVPLDWEKCEVSDD